jgi:hypothetical protein
MTLFGPFLQQAGHILDVFVAPGQKILAVTLDPAGLSVVDPLDGTHGPVYPIGQAKRPKAGTALVAGGSTWMIYEKTQPGFQPGGQVVERGVVKVTVTASGEVEFAQVGPTYDDATVVPDDETFVPEALAVAGDGSLWVALRSTFRQHSRVDRIWAPPAPGRGLHWNPALLPSSIRLPRGWVPSRITQGESGPLHDPGFLYLLGGYEHRDKESFLACVWLTPSTWPRTFPTQPGYEVSPLAKLAVAGVHHELVRGADGSVWALGSEGSTGWLVRHRASDDTAVWKDSKHQYRAVVEGPEHTNTHGNKYRAMFLARRFVDADSDDQSDIETFREDPVSGLGWTTAPDSHLVTSGNDVGKTIQPKITIEGLSPRTDGQGNYWFGYVAQGVPGNVFGTGFFEPPKGDPLDPP